MADQEQTPVKPKPGIKEGLFVGWPRDVNNVNSTQRKQRESIGQEQTLPAKENLS